MPIILSIIIHCISYKHQSYIGSWSTTGSSGNDNNLSEKNKELPLSETLRSTLTGTGKHSRSLHCKQAQKVSQLPGVKSVTDTHSSNTTYTAITSFPKA